MQGLARAFIARCFFPLFFMVIIKNPLPLVVDAPYSVEESADSPDVFVLSDSTGRILATMQGMNMRERDGMTKTEFFDFQQLEEQTDKLLEIAPILLHVVMAYLNSETPLQRADAHKKAHAALALAQMDS